MDEEDRKNMRANCDKLVKEINWRIMLPKLIEHGIYRREHKDVQQWMEDNNHGMNKNREIYLQIMKRGPSAFEEFIKCLKEIDRNDLAQILKPEENSLDQVDNQTNNTIPEVNGNNNNTESNMESIEVESDDYWTRFQKTKEPLKIVVKKATKFTEKPLDVVPCYPMRSNPRGLVLIINNTLFAGGHDKRDAAEHDEANLKDLFQQMGFSVEISKNLTRQEMLERIEAFSKEPKLRHVHSTFVIVMSHGNEHVVDNRSQSLVCGIDNKCITDAEVVDFFTTEACENMHKKPKVFIFQTCRGDKVQQAVNASNISLGRDGTDVNQFVSPAKPFMVGITRNVSDMLVAYSTLPGHKAHRDKFTGSWYIQTLCEVMMNHAHHEELQRMLQMADQRLSRMQTGGNGCQTSTYMSWGFNKQCYLNPGYFGD